MLSKEIWRERDRGREREIEGRERETEKAIIILKDLSALEA